MADCREFEPAFTAYVDGECSAPQRSVVEAHLQVCPRCRNRVLKERTTHELLRERCHELRGAAPDALRRRCAAQRVPTAMPPAVRRPWVPWSVAATLVCAAGVFLLFGWGSSVETYAAQLAVDHLKCFQFSPEPVPVDAVLLGRQWQAANGWPLKLAPAAPDQQLELLTVRRCGSTRGRVVHALYRWRGAPLSLYVLNSHIDELPDGRQQPGSHEVVRKFGEQEIIWSEKGRTYAVVARASLDDLQPVARYLRRLTE
jgi:hypothetical protein